MLHPDSDTFERLKEFFQPGSSVPSVGAGGGLTSQQLADLSAHMRKHGVNRGDHFAELQNALNQGVTQATVNLQQQSDSNAMAINSVAERVLRVENMLRDSPLMEVLGAVTEENQRLGDDNARLRELLLQSEAKRQELMDRLISLSDRVLRAGVGHLEATLGAPQVVVKEPPSAEHAEFLRGEESTCEQGVGR